MIAEDLVRLKTGNTIYGERTGSPYQVDTIADLKALDVEVVPANVAVIVLGYYETGDSGGGLFVYDNASSLADNYGTVIAPDAGAGRWIRVWSGTVSVRWFGCLGDGTTDETARIQAAFDAAENCVVDFKGGYIYAVSESLVPVDGMRTKGKSALKALPTFSSGAVIEASGNVGLDIDEIEVNGNAGGGAQCYGIRFVGGSDNNIGRVYVHDTSSAGAAIGNESGSSISSQARFIDCGRTGSTDDHGIMLYAIDGGTLENIRVVRPTVTGAFRKGVAVYADNSGALVNNIEIEEAEVVDCDLGGIYMATEDFSASKIRNVRVRGGYASGNPVNLEMDNIDGALVSGLCAKENSGSGNFVFTGVTNLAVTGCFLTDSFVHGILFAQGTTGGTVNNSNTSLVGNVIRRSNRSEAGTGAAIYFSHCTYSSGVDNIITDDDSFTTHGIIEVDSSDYNSFSRNIISGILGATVANYIYSTATHSAISGVIGANLGVGTGAATNTLDLSGTLSIRSQTIALVNGANSNVALPIGASTLYVSGPSGVFNITGIAGGTDGRLVTLVNYSGQTMTMTYNSGSSSAGNKILIGGSGDLAITANGSVTLQWVAAATAWFVVSYKA